MNVFESVLFPLFASGDSPACSWVIGGRFAYLLATAFSVSEGKDPVYKDGI